MIRAPRAPTDGAAVCSASLAGRTLYPAASRPARSRPACPGCRKAPASRALARCRLQPRAGRTGAGSIVMPAAATRVLNGAAGWLPLGARPSTCGRAARARRPPIPAWPRRRARRRMAPPTSKLCRKSRTPPRALCSPGGRRRRAVQCEAQGLPHRHAGPSRPRLLPLV